MTKLSQPPTPAVVAAVLSGFFATFLLVVGVYALSQGGTPIVLGIAALLVAITWTLWTGRRSGRLSAILVGVFLVAVGIFVSESLTMRVLNIGFGLTLVALLTLPASVRAHYGDRRHPVAG